jgi:MoaA/NifB/PqqE/SkfB family radical SAM enzyme
MSLSDDARQWTSYLRVGIVPTFGCNLRCRHCFVESVPGDREMSAEQFLALLGQIEALGVLSLELTGGELFHWGAHRAVLRALGRAKLPVTISTNGTLLEPEHLTALAGGRVSFCFSLDGPEAVHDRVRGSGAFARTARAAALCRERDVPFDLSCTVTRSSLALIDAMAACASEWGAGAVLFSPIHRLGGRSEAMAGETLDDEGCIDLLARVALLRKRAPAGLEIQGRGVDTRVVTVTHPCSVCACWGEFCPSKKYWPTKLSVTPDGEVLPQSLHVHPRYSLGNAFERGLEAVIAPYWGSARHKQFQRLCRYVYQDLIYRSDRLVFLWEELLHQASLRPSEELPAYDTVSHPYDHSAEIEAARRAGTLGPGC